MCIRDSCSSARDPYGVRALYYARVAREDVYKRQEVEYPGWVERGGHDRPNAGALKWLWRERRCSSEALDHSGVWRFREMLPILDNFGNAVTLREGNTPLYHLPRASKALGIDQLFAKHQGMNPTGSFKDTGMTAALSVAKERGFQWVACASTGNRCV